MARIPSFPGAHFCCPRTAIAPSARGLIALAVLGAFSASAFAASQVRLKLEGNIAPECTIGGGSRGSSTTLGVPLELGDITKPGRKDYAFLVNCNAPFSYHLEAQYGALTSAGVEKAPDGFTTAIPYDVTVRIPTDGAPIHDRCPSESLRSGRVTCPFSNSGNNIAMESEAQLSVTWRSPGAMVPAGKYVERLTISVTTTL